MTSAKLAGMRTRIRDIAREAGVGTATVDRVLNERGSVAEETATRVLEVARRLGTNRLLPDSHRPLLRLVLLLPTPQSHFRHRLAEAFRVLKGSLDRNLLLEVNFVDPRNVEYIARAIQETRAQAIAFCAIHDPGIVLAVRHARQRGIHVFTIVSDYPESEREAYFGIDNLSAARTAVCLAAPNTRPTGTAIVLTTAIDGAALSQRIEGFQSALGEYLPAVRTGAVYETGDTTSACRKALEQAFTAFSDVVLIYNCGAANSAVGEVLRLRDPRRKIQFIGHELTPNTRKMLQENRMYLTIDQNPALIARNAVETMAAACGFSDGQPIPAKCQFPCVPFSIFTKENLPPILP